MATLILKPRARILHGHDWVYGTEVAAVKGEPQDGGVVTLKDKRGRILGSAIYNSQSQIVARRFCRQKQLLDVDFFQRRIAQALAYRHRHGYHEAQAMRVVWSESDGLPGLIIDRYAECVVVQALTLAMDLALPQITRAILEVLEPATIIARNDAPIRRAEGMELDVAVLHGPAVETVAVTIGGIEFQIAPLGGQKTGFYLDQVMAYPRVATFAGGRRVLDCFANQGAFALHCAKAGASYVRAVDISTDCVAAIKVAAANNGLAVDSVPANVFDYLNELRSGDERFDLIILDPPSFTRSKGKHADALRGYKEIHLRALSLLNPEGYLATFSCSHHISATDLREVIVAASVDARRYVRVIDTFAQALDHPVLPHIPETEYLHGYLLEALPPR